MRYRDGADIGVLDLLMFVDMMPPPAFTLVPKVGWVQTVELTVQLKGKPAPGPILCRARSHTLMNGVTELDCEIWDSQGELVALGRQTMKVRSMS
jgi:acyl-coenzyme A thioesterase PaaI-like protein